MRNVKRHILIVAALLIGASCAHAQPQTGKPDLKAIVFPHLSDSYGWHIITLPSGAEVVLPLPVIACKNDGSWHVFSSSRLRDGGIYKGFAIAADGSEYSGKLIEVLPGGGQARPWDLSLTKTALALIINTLILIVIFTVAVRGYKNNPLRAPRGITAAIEMLTVEITDSVIKPCVGEEHYRRYAPFLLTLFFFILINNMMGIIPFFPGGANTTGNIAVTMVLALATFLAVNIFGTREYWKEIFNPDVPTWMKLPLPLMPAIELFGIFTKPFALMIRLFANMLAGHAITIGLTCLVFATATAGWAVNGSMSALSVVMGVFMMLVEILVSFLQAYVFTMLSAIFIGLSKVKKHEEKQITQ